jgi:argininosuccinate lyase
MIESWVGGTGRLLPATITARGHEYTFVTRARAHYQDARTRQLHPVFEHARHVLTAETNDRSSLVSFLRRQHEVLHFDGVLTICDYYIDTVADVATALRLPHAFSTDVATQRRKHKVRQALQDAGLPNPLFAVTASWDETRHAATDIGYPLVMKPSDLASSAFVRLVHDERELFAAFTALDAFTENFRHQARESMWLLEEYMTGQEVSVEACTYGGVTTILGVTDKSVIGFPYFVEDGHMFPAELDSATRESICALTRKALEAVQLHHGVSHTEVKLTAQGPRIVEINPRPGGNYIAELIQHVTGIDILGAQIDLALGHGPDLVGRETGITSAAIKFLVPPRGGHVMTVQGIDSLEHNHHLARWSISDLSGVDVPPPIDNACYQGHVVALDCEGFSARRYAEEALAGIRLLYQHEATAVAS